jgi:hypothetical protein
MAKKLPAKKTSGSTHKDKNSHNVRISVISGSERHNKNILKRLNQALKALAFAEVELTYWLQVKPKGKEESAERKKALKYYMALISNEKRNINLIKRSI